MLDLELYDFVGSMRSEESGGQEKQFRRRIASVRNLGVVG